MAIELAGRRTLIVGAGGGVGGATARLFHAHGARVIPTGRPGAGLDAVAEAVGAPPEPLDMLDPAAVTRVFEGAAFDHVVIAAASTTSGSVEALPLDKAKASMESKFWGAYTVARAAIISDGGSLTFVSGFLSRRPSASAVLQGAINAALEALGRGLALERAPVRVNTVSPGLVDTPLWAGLPDEARAAMFERARASLPARRVGRPEDVAQAILLVATNPYMTGATVTVDGGGSIA